MKFSIAAVLAMATVAFAYPVVDANSHVKRQNIVTLDPATPSMSDQGGNVVPFDSARVNQVGK
ncbi:hypothetical protein QBC35DRAFT_459433 [Podospora australis]|uniref:Uncharacterized protein n=1 Tax=Podospora australis TaxID=1536484 RepID=A0AAN7ANW6_9PEZI|nr:hypothetical protein QBC35DRAFT_459433 [Podospora australis]